MTTRLLTSSIEMIPPNGVTTDSRVNTRPVDRAWVQRKLREGFDEKRIGVPTVSMREDGSFVWLDGQNRGELCKAAGRGDEAISMKVFRGLSLAEEAELFLGLNDNRKVAPIYKFIAEVTARRPEAVEITRIASEFNWSVSDNGSTNNIAAVAALSSIYRSTNPPGTTLRVTLSIVTQAWGHSQESVTAPILLGLASVLNDSPNLSTVSMVKKLASYDGGPASLLGKGRGFRSATGCTVTQGVDQVIRATYNNGRRSGRLNTWGPPAARTATPQEQMTVRF
ncbi:DUF6551 family protein [Streptacidiphilus sp. MAP5-3]|uniref:DUF6551 family protein n=1 Tax=unclassified Streptacidiphilus TaxID=2643834 RepID=UPI0035161607